MKIGIVSPSSTFTALVKDIAARLKLDVAIKEGALRQGIYCAEVLCEEGSNVIVARGPTADLLEAHIEVPVIKVSVNNFDLLRTFQKAKQYADNIMFIDCVDNENVYDLSFIEHMLEIDIDLKQYKNEADIKHHIQMFAAQDIEGREKIVVGTAQCLARTAINRGLRSFVVNSTHEAVAESLKRAKETSLLYEKEKLRQQHLSTIISHAFDGVIATDHDGKVSVYNEVASHIIGLKKTEVLGRLLKKMQHLYMKKLYGDGSAATKLIVSLGNKRYVVNRIPIDDKKESMVITFLETNKLIQLESQVRSQLYNRRFYAKHTFEDIVYESELMRQTIDVATKYSTSNSSILIQGESGVGKELFAQSIHNTSSRRNGPFIAINCAAMPENLLESELFGYEEGAFTGAKKGGKPGMFEMAHEGTLFLDEVGDIPSSLQVRLLRVLQEKEVMRLGGQRIIPVNVRVVSATNKDLKASIKQKQFREDLYYRLNALKITIPPLRERKEDIYPLIRHMLQKNGNDISVVSPDIIEALVSYDWPGNVREMENVFDRMSALGDASFLDIKRWLFDEQPEGHRKSSPVFSIPEDKDRGCSDRGPAPSIHYVKVKIGPLKEIENQIIRHLYHSYSGNRQEIANVLGVSRTTLWKKLKELMVVS